MREFAKATQEISSLTDSCHEILAHENMVLLKKSDELICQYRVQSLYMGIPCTCSWLMMCFMTITDSVAICYEQLGK